MTLTDSTGHRFTPVSGHVEGDYVARRDEGKNRVFDVKSGVV
jgi:hypothetical protein